MFKSLHFLYIALGYLFLPFLWLFLRWRLICGKENKQRLPERYGKPTLKRPKGTLLWIHGASVGESLSALPLLEGIQQNYPNITILMTSGTVTSSRILKKRLPPGAIHQFIALDAQFYVNRFLNHWKPDLVFWLESELWPNHLLALKNRHIPVILVNARLSPSAYKSWSFFKLISKNILSCFCLCLASTQNVAKKLKKLGAQNIKTPGNLKYAAGPLPIDEEAFIHLQRILKNRPLWVAASTHPGEEKIFIETHKFLKRSIPNILTILIPRHPERGEAILEEARKSNLTITRRSLDHDPTNETDIYLSDTLGELGLFFCLSSIVVMGGSFVSIGGHNPLEPAYFKTALVWGPHMFNFPEIEKNFLKNKSALKVSKSKKLNSILLDLLTHPNKAEKLGILAKKELREQENILQKTLKYIDPYIKKSLKDRKRKT